ncbi:TPA: hypothetical protein UM352_001131 [Stenotrophomonas maltophilia]|nr:hypothetical protein [Stenotrophomonas maltophilia]
MADPHGKVGNPTEFMYQLVRICEEHGHTLDPFVGSSTMHVVAGLAGYSWTGIEMTRHYFEVVSRRLLAD